MSYEIPQNLQYREKLLFNLTMAQAGWIAIFGIPGAAIILKTELALEIKIMVALVLGTLAFGFAFLNFKQHTTALMTFIITPRKAGYYSKLMDKFIEVKKIDSDTITLNNGQQKAIIQVQPINFHILSTRQQQAIIGKYKDFLNSLDFPIQIIMRTVNLSLDDYFLELELKVKKSKNQKLFTQFQDFKEFMTKYIEENGVQNRLFYIAIPAEKTNKFQQNQDIATGLDNRVRICQEKLRECNLVTKRLSTNELVSLLSSYFEGFVETNNDYQSFMTILEGVEKSQSKENSAQ